MSNKIIFIKNAKQYVKNIKNNLDIANICNKTAKEVYKGD